MKKIFLLLFLVTANLFGQIHFVHPSSAPTLIANDKSSVTVAKDATAQDSLLFYATGNFWYVDSVKGSSEITIDSLDGQDSTIVPNVNRYVYFTRETGTVGTFNSTIDFYCTASNPHSQYDIPYEVIPASNVLLPPTDLVAQADSEGILITWTDSNIADTVISIQDDFTSSYDGWVANTTGVTASISSGKLKVERTSGTSSWHSVRQTFTDLRSDRWYEFSVDAEVGTATSVWMVIEGYIADVKQLPLLFNGESLGDTTYTYVMNNPTYDSVRVILQTRVTATNQYSLFDNFQFRKTESSYDEWRLYAQSYYLGSPFGEYSLLASASNDNNSYYHNASLFIFEDGSDSAEYGYYVEFVKDATTSVPSNEDTAVYHSPTVPNPSAEIFVDADYWIRTDAGTNDWATYAADSTEGVTLDTLNAHWADVGTNKTIAFHRGQYHKGRIEIDGDIYPLDTLTLTAYGGTADAEVGVFDTLNGWSNASLWINEVPRATGSTWKFDISSHPTYTTSSTPYWHRLWLDGVEYQMKLPADSEIGGISTSPASSYGYSTYNDVYRFRNAMFGASGHDSLVVWTPDGSKPSSYYSSIEVSNSDASETTAWQFDDIDSLTIKHLSFKGGDLNTLNLNNCDYAVIDSTTFSKTNYRNVWIFSSMNVRVTNNRFIGMDDVHGDSVYYENASREGLVITGNSDSAYIYNNTISNYSTAGINVFAATDGGDYQSPDYGIADSNYIYDNVNRFYTRGMQINSLDPSDVGPHPIGWVVTRNFFENMTIPYKWGGKTEILVAYNIFTFKTVTWSYVIDHAQFKTYDDGAFHEPYAGAKNCYKYYLHNTIYNTNSYLDKNTNPYYYNVFENNLFLNLNRGNNQNGVDIYLSPTNRLQTYVNNYSFSDPSGTYQTYFNGANYTWANFNSISNAYLTASDNVRSTETNLANVINQTTYEINLSNTAIKDAGLNISSQLPLWLTHDRYNNPITGNGDNIGAINN